VLDYRRLEGKALKLLRFYYAVMTNPALWSKKVAI